MVFISAEDGGTGDFLTTADGEGRFRFEVFRQADLAVSAELREGEGTCSSPATTIPPSDGGEAGPLRLTLRRKVKWSGRVISPQGPVAGAVISAWPLSGASGIWARAGSESTERSLSMGRPKAVRLVIVPRAPGFALTRRSYAPPGPNPWCSTSPRGRRSRSRLVLDVRPRGDGLPPCLLRGWDRHSLWQPPRPLGDGARRCIDLRAAVVTSIRIPSLPGRWDVCALLRTTWPSVSQPAARHHDRLRRRDSRSRDHPLPGNIEACGSGSLRRIGAAPLPARERVPDERVDPTAIRGRRRGRGRRSGRGRPSWWVAR